LLKADFIQGTIATGSHTGRNWDQPQLRQEQVEIYNQGTGLESVDRKLLSGNVKDKGFLTKLI
jgi:hypothetical protein